MDKEMVDTAPLGPTAMESAQQYVDSGIVALQLAQFIRRLGYSARAHIDGNYRVVCPLVARDAGLGELGRMGLLMTPDLGPRVQREFRNMTRKLRRSLRRTVERGTVVEWIGIEALMESLEVVSIAYDSARDSTGEHLRGAFWDSMEFIKRSPLSAPWRVAANNARITFRILGEVADISRETLDDLSRVNQERKDHLRLLDRD